MSFSSKVEFEKSSAYECGFVLLKRLPNIIFDSILAHCDYVSSIDIEVLYLYPIITSVLDFSVSNLLILAAFFVVLAVGIVYEISRQIMNMNISEATRDNGIMSVSYGKATTSGDFGSSAASMRNTSTYSSVKPIGGNGSGQDALCSGTGLHCSFRRCFCSSSSNLLRSESSLRKVVSVLSIDNNKARLSLTLCLRRILASVVKKLSCVLAYRSSVYSILASGSLVSRFLASCVLAYRSLISLVCVCCSYIVFVYSFMAFYLKNTVSEIPYNLSMNSDSDSEQPFRLNALEGDPSYDSDSDSDSEPYPLDYRFKSNVPTALKDTRTKGALGDIANEPHVRKIANKPLSPSQEPVPNTPVQDPVYNVPVPNTPVQYPVPNIDPNLNVPPVGEDLPTMIRVPEGTRDMPQIHHNPNVPHGSEDLPESPNVWLDLIIPIAIIGVGVIIIGGVIYYIWKKRKKTPPTDGEGDGNSDSTSSKKESTQSSSNTVSKFTIGIILQIDLLFLFISFSFIFALQLLSMVFTT